MFDKLCAAYGKWCEQRRRDELVRAMGIDCAAIDRDLSANRQSGVAEPPSGQPRLVVSMTSFPARICEVKYVVHSLLRQTMRPWKIVLWLGIEQFPGREGDLPSDLLSLINRGLEIRFVKDTRSYKKLIPALAEFPDDYIITADDDTYYPEEWAEILYRAGRERPDCVSGLRVHRVDVDGEGRPKPYAGWRKLIGGVEPSYLNFATGCGGIVYPPHVLDEAILEEERFRSLAPMNDDIWFWAMAVLKGTKINVLPFDQGRFKLVRPERELGFTDEPTLFKSNMMGNDAQIGNVLSHYPRIVERLRGL